MILSIISLSLVTLTALSLVGCATDGYGQKTAPPGSNHVNEARYFLDQDQIDSALVAFGLAIKENSRLSSAHMGMGHIYRQQGNYLLASKSYKITTDLEPNNFDACFHLGLCYQLGGKIDEAVTTFLRAVVIRPDSYDANEHLGSALLQARHLEEAVPYLQRATKLQPHSHPAWANLAVAYNQLKDYEKAVDAFRQANELSDNQTPLLLGYANVLIKLKRYPQAANVLNTVLRQESNIVAYERLGYCQWKQRHYVQALDNFQAALHIIPNDIASLNGKGVCLMTIFIQGGHKDRDLSNQAIGAWQQSVKNKPDQPRIIDLIARYQRP